jgi:chromosome segregation ATPase
MSLFGNIFKSSAESVQTAAIQLGAKQFPDLMTNAQLLQFRDQVRALGDLVAHAQTAVNAAQTEATSTDAEFQRYRAAAKELAAQAASAGLDGDNAHAPANPKEQDLLNGMHSAIDKATRLKATLAKAQERLQRAQSDLAQAQADQQSAALHAQEAEQRLVDKKAEATRTNADVAREQQRRDDAERAAGLSHSVNTLTAVEDAMDANLRKQQEKLASLKATNDAYHRASSVATGGDALQAALSHADGNASGSGAGKSTSDKLAALD